ncbi:MAG: ComF family protein [Chloroflexi bacterium]|nr:ComF family protein [Chloroflexota bacterium]
MQVDGIRAPFLMEGLVRDALIRFKYGGLRVLGPVLADFLLDCFDRPLPADLLIPVPLHPSRERERGYNQARILAQALSKATGLPVDAHSLVRQRSTPPQVRAQDAAHRRAAMAGAFLCQGNRVVGQRILLVDDVCTTGSTLDSCAGALKSGGARSVWALVVAREP